MDRLEQDLQFAAGYVSRLISGKLKEPTVSRAAKIARRLGVRLEWLAENAGAMRDATIATILEIEDAYPERARALARFRGGQYDDAIARVRSRAYSGVEGWPEEAWVEELLREHARARWHDTAKPTAKPRANGRVNKKKKTDN